MAERIIPTSNKPDIIKPLGQTLKNAALLPVDLVHDGFLLASDIVGILPLILTIQERIGKMTDKTK